MSIQRITANLALEIMQGLPLDCSDIDGSGYEMEAVLKAAVASVQEESNSSDSKDEANSPGRNAPPLAQGGAGLFQERDGSRWKTITDYPATQGSLQLRVILRF